MEIDTRCYILVRRQMGADSGKDRIFRLEFECFNHSASWYKIPHDPHTTYEGSNGRRPRTP